MNRKNDCPSGSTCENPNHGHGIPGGIIFGGRRLQRNEWKCTGGGAGDDGSDDAALEIGDSCSEWLGLAC